MNFQRLAPVCASAAALLLSQAGSAHATTQDDVLAYLDSKQLKVIECVGTARVISNQGEGMAQVQTNLVYQMQNGWGLHMSTSTLLNIAGSLYFQRTSLNGWGTVNGDGGAGLRAQDGALVAEKSDTPPLGVTMWVKSITLDFDSLADDPSITGVLTDDKNFSYPVQCRFKARDQG